MFLPVYGILALVRFSPLLGEGMLFVDSSPHMTMATRVIKKCINTTFFFVFFTLFVRPQMIKQSDLREKASSASLAPMSRESFWWTFSSFASLLQHLNFLLRKVHHCGLFYKDEGIGLFIVGHHLLSFFRS